MRKLIPILGVIFFMLMLAYSKNVLAQSPFESINQKLDQIQNTLDNQILPKLDECSHKVRVPRTGQTTSYLPGGDSDLQMGVPWPVPRFSDRGDGTVRDNLTGLVWLKDASCTSFFPGDNTGVNFRNWTLALTAANLLESGYCGLSDGSVAGDWRLPNVRELESLIDYGRDNPSFPEGHPSVALVAGRYWSSTPSGSYALLVNFYFGYPGHDYKDNEFYIWPVRDAK